MSEQLIECTTCGLKIPREKAVKKERWDGEYYFCCEYCSDWLPEEPAYRFAPWRVRRKE